MGAIETALPTGTEITTKALAFPTVPADISSSPPRKCIAAKVPSSTTGTGLSSGGDRQPGSDETNVSRDVVRVLGERGYPRPFGRSDVAFVAAVVVVDQQSEAEHRPRLERQRCQPAGGQEYLVDGLLFALIAHHRQSHRRVGHSGIEESILARRHHLAQGLGATVCESEQPGPIVIGVGNQGGTILECVDEQLQGVTAPGLGQRVGLVVAVIGHRGRQQRSEQRGHSYGMRNHCVLSPSVFFCR